MRELQVIRLLNNRMIIVNEVMDNIIIICGYNTQFEILNLFSFSKILNNSNSFNPIILVVGNVKKQGKECENWNDNGNNISIVFTICNGNNYHNQPSIIAMKLNKLG